MSLSFSFAGVETGALENNVDTELTPRKLSCIRLSVDSDLLAVNSDRTRSNNSLTILCENSVLESYSVLALTELTCETTLSGVVFQKVCQHLRAGQVVDCNYLITLSFKHLTECQTTNTAEAVNSYFCHNCVIIFVICVLIAFVFFHLCAAKVLYFFDIRK